MGLSGQPAWPEVIIEGAGGANYLGVVAPPEQPCKPETGKAQQYKKATAFPRNPLVRGARVAAVILVSDDDVGEGPASVLKPGHQPAHSPRSQASN